jgi:hypothetical protein
MTAECYRAMRTTSTGTEGQRDDAMGWDRVEGRSHEMRAHYYLATIE